MTNHPPYSILELTKEEHDFLVRNCESNIAVALGIMQNSQDRTTLERLVELNENFKSILDKLKRAQK